MQKEVVLTREGLNKLESELLDLKVNRRKDVAAKIKEARGQGDLSENAEYDAAKEEQAEIEARILSVENTLRHAVVINDNNGDDKVTLGSKVVLFDFEFEEEVIYTIVGSIEADPMNGKISNESLLGINLIGKFIGDVISYETEDGTEKFEVKDIVK